MARTLVENPEIFKLPFAKVEKFLYGKWHHKGANMSEIKNQYKLIILYDNGKKFTAKGVMYYLTVSSGSERSSKLQTLIYTCYDSKTKVQTKYKIPATDIAAITVKKADEIYTKRFKSCAVISGGAEKRENNHQQLQKVNLANVENKNNKVAETDTEATSKQTTARSGFFKRQSGSGKQKLRRPVR